VNNDPIITFSCREWAIRKHAPVLKANEFFPKEYKDLEAGATCPFDHLGEGTYKSLKLCPAVTGYMGAGYVIPAWGDILFDFDNNGNLNIQYSNLDYQSRFHTQDQFGNLLDDYFKVRVDVKLDNPWSIKTAPGYSVMWLPMFYHNVNYQALPAIMDTDIMLNHNPINLMLKEPKRTLIKMGDPLVHIIPFKREDITAVSKELDSIDEKRHESILGLARLSRFGWRSFIKEKINFFLDRRDIDLK